MYSKCPKCGSGVEESGGAEFVGGCGPAPSRQYSGWVYYECTNPDCDWRANDYVPGSDGDSGGDPYESIK
jgi:hypothetical protein